MKRRLPRRALDGVLLLDKPVGPSSNDALQRVRWLMAARKAGHGGTLDPQASGLLPVGFGEATKFINMMLEADKTYEAVIELGARSSTGDAEGVLETIDPARACTLADGEILAVLEQFVGEIDQLPPMHAALKHEGRPLYAYARAGQEIERRSRRVRIHRIDLLERAAKRLRIRACVAKGTYIRVLAQDIGEKLGTGGWLAGLRRTAVGPFGVGQAVTLASLAAEVGLDADGAHPAMAQADWHCPADRRLLPVEAMLGELPRVDLRNDQARQFAHGQALYERICAQPGACRVYGPDRFIGLGRCDDTRLHPVRLIASSAQS
ncbi:MAG: tRNA pseudouridine(55) synthase TruB [Burkholderiaceae bacterium]